MRIQYSVMVNFEGMTISEYSGLTRLAAIKLAKSEASSDSNEDNQIFVTWFRKSDQQHGYLNRGGDHEITGLAW